MTDADLEVIASVNRLTEKRFQLEIERDAENQRFESALADMTHGHEEKLRIFAGRGRELDPEIWSSVDDNRDSLIARGKRSFVTMVAKFQLRDVPAKTEIRDKRAIMEVARKLGVVRQIANPPRAEWRFNQKKFLAWLATHGEQRRHFEQFIDDIDKTESLTVQPNSNYTVMHNSVRISPPSITIKKS